VFGYLSPHVPFSPCLGQLQAEPQAGTAAAGLQDRRCRDLTPPPRHPSIRQFHGLGVVCWVGHGTGTECAIVNFNTAGKDASLRHAREIINIKSK